MYLGPIRPASVRLAVNPRGMRKTPVASRHPRDGAIVSGRFFLPAFFSSAFCVVQCLRVCFWFPLFIWFIFGALVLRLVPRGSSKWFGRREKPAARPRDRLRLSSCSFLLFLFLLVLPFGTPCCPINFGIRRELQFCRSLNVREHFTSFRKWSHLAGGTL